MELPLRECHVWYVEPSQLSVELAAGFVELLSADERARCRRFLVPHAAQQFLLGRALTRSLLAAYLGDLAGELTFGLSEAGKPALVPARAGVCFSLAHCPGLVACAFARECDLGLDVEDVERPIDALAIAQHFFAAEEQAELRAFPAAARARAFYAHWTLKEACLKAEGAGLGAPLSRFRFAIAAHTPPRMIAGESSGSWQLAQLQLDDRHLIAVAMRARHAGELRRVRTQRWQPPS
jgi:4'-phosphopantetheinyl transferase